MGAFGGYERGWEQVSARLDWAAAGIKATDRAAENIVTVVGDDLACTVDLEHMIRHAGDQPQSRTLRCTQAYRRENGEWKVILRHATSLPAKTNTKGDPQSLRLGLGDRRADDAEPVAGGEFEPARDVRIRHARIG